MFVRYIVSLLHLVLVLYLTAILLCQSYRKIQDGNW